jgi:hypothetical protein
MLRYRIFFSGSIIVSLKSLLVLFLFPLIATSFNKLKLSLVLEFNSNSNFSVTISLFVKKLLSYLIHYIIYLFGD